jgi:hypothetical protein
LKFEKQNRLIYGFVLIVLGVIFTGFFYRLIFPPELVFSDEKIPVWAKDSNFVSNLALVGYLGAIVFIGIIIIGLILFVSGIRGRTYDTGFRETLVKLLTSERSFFTFFLLSLIWGILWFFNTLTTKIGPLEFPGYFYRASFLQEGLPTVAVENLASHSTYQAFSVGMDFVILLVFIYMLYVRIRPEEQKFETLINYLFAHPMFFIIFWGISFYHILGHTPWEWYGVGLWGGGLEQDLVGTLIPFTQELEKSITDGWLAFDHFAHMGASVMITMILVSVITRQLKKMETPITERTIPRFAYISALFFMLAIGVLWELLEIIMFRTFTVINLTSTEIFVSEYIDSMKDMVFDLIGGLVGLGLSKIDNWFYFRGKSNV